MKNGKIIFAFAALCAALLLSACGSAGSARRGAGELPLIADLVVQGGDVTDAMIDTLFNNLSANINDGLSVALMTLYSGNGMDADTANLVTVDLQIKFFDSKKYNMLERERINQVIEQQKFEAQYASNETAVQIGRILGANVIIIGSVEGRGVTQRIIMRALEVSTGRILSMFMQQFERERGFSEIVVTAETFPRNARLKNNEYNIQTEIIRIPADSQVVFKVPNGRWVIETGNERGAITADLMRDTRLYAKVHRPGRSDFDIVEEVRREPIASASQDSIARAAFAREAAAKLTNELRGKTTASTGTAFFPLTSQSITSDDSDFLFDAMNIELANSGQMNLIEKQKLAALLNEFDFQMSGAVGVRTMGQMLGADVVIFGIAARRTIELVAVDVARFTILAQVTHSY